MATRFYLPASTAADVSPGFDSWDGTGSAVRRELAEVKGSSAMAAGTTISWATTGSAGKKHLDRQYVSNPLAAQTISGPIKMQLLVQEGSLTDNIDQIILSIRVVSNDGTAVRGTLLSLGSYGPTTEYSTAYRNKTGADGDALSSVNAQDGDRLVVEIGHSTSVGGTTPDATARYGETGTELPEDETTIGPPGGADAPGWVEFSGAMAMQDTDAAKLNLLYGKGAGDWLLTNNRLEETRAGA